MRPSLECAIFPDLHPYHVWCDSVVSESGRWFSVEESLSAKIWSALIDYAVDTRLHQYHFDRWQWTTVSAAQSIANQLEQSLSFTLSEKWFSLEYMFNAAAAVVDIVRQLGPPHWFWTFAPAEWTFPMHMSITDVSIQSHALDAFSVGGVVAAHIAHSITSVIKGILLGLLFELLAHRKAVKHGIGTS